jgi:hypothetical protein
MEKDLFQIPATISGIQTLKDRTIKITAYASREMKGEEKAKLFDLENMEGWLLFSSNKIQPNDVPKEQAKIEGNRKSLSERLYNVLFVYYNQNYSDTSNFESWRQTQMERIIESYKSKLR